MYQKGIATGIALGLARPWKKRNNFTINANIKRTDCISRYCKVSLLVVHHIAFHSLTGATFKTKERRTSTLLPVVHIPPLPRLLPLPRQLPRQRLCASFCWQILLSSDYTQKQNQTAAETTERRTG